MNDKTLTQVSQRYTQVFYCLKVIMSLLNLPTGGHGHVICMGELCHTMYKFVTLFLYMNVYHMTYKINTLITKA